MTDRASILRLASIFAAIAFVAIVTLTPRQDLVPARFDWRLPINPRELVESVLNAVLFMPFGAALYFNRHRLRTAAGLGFGLSLMVELLQRFFIRGREGEMQDLLTNTLGAIIGWLLLRTMVPRRPPNEAK